MKHKYLLILSGITICILLKLIGNHFSGDIRDFFNTLAIAVPGAVITFSLLKKNEVRK